MFGSTILDVAIGLIFSFLAISLFTSATVEAINSLLQLRAVNLKSGIMALVNDPGFAGLAKRLYEHPLVSPMGPGIQAGPAAAAAPQAPAAGAAPQALAPGAAPQAQAAARPATDNSTYISRVKDVAMFWRPAGPPYIDIKTLPAYIDKSQFARALMDVTGLSAAWAAGAAAAPAGAQPGGAALNAAIAAIANPQIRNFIQGVSDRTQGDISAIEKEVGAWFDGAMDRVSGEFKRWTQAATFAVALAAAVLLNVDSIRIGQTLWAHPAIADQLLAAQQPQLPQSGAVPQSTPAQSPNFLTDEKAAFDNIQALLDAGLPIGWPSGQLFDVSDGRSKTPLYIWSSQTFGQSLVGWLITAFATLFGAPFWFDALQSIIRLKGAGPSPDDKTTKRAASS
jgi:hypothetical protein